MAFKMRYQIKQLFLTSPSKRASGKPIDKVKFLVAHDTGNEGSTARANVMYYERSINEIAASAHIFVDDLEIIECIPAFTNPKKAWHVLYNVDVDNKKYGTDANDSAIGVELCYGGQINNMESYRKYVWILAYLCDRYNLNPMLHIVGHSELDPRRKTDPENALKHINKTMEDLLEDVQFELIVCRNEDSDMKEILDRLETLEKRCESLEKVVRVPIPDWAKPTVEAAVKRGIITNFDVATMDFYKVLVILSRCKVI